MLKPSFCSSEAKQVLAGGVVRVNGDVESRRGRQLVVGDTVSLGSQIANVTQG